LAVALAEACISGDRGATLTLPIDISATRADHLLFAEGGGRILVSVAPDQVTAWETYLQTQIPGHWQALGQVRAIGGSLEISTADNLVLIHVGVKEMGDRWHQAIERRLSS
jgi:phosphoribosylformylglycinamidine synthase subunit PurL